MPDPKRCVLLMTGFEPFGRYRVNSSWEAVSLAAARLGPGVVVARLPVDRRRAAAELRRLLELNKPHACLLTGLAGTRLVRVESVARRPRALAGPDDPVWLRGQWPVAELALPLRRRKLPVKISLNAGKYVCDSTYWALLKFRQSRGWPSKTCFLHVPPLSRRFTARVLGEAIADVATRYLNSRDWETDR
jgi:pyroglutamyl-peptidase